MNPLGDVSALLDRKTVVFLDRKTGGEGGT